MADFTVSYSVFGELQTHELVPDGANVPVTNENRHEYARLYVQVMDVWQ